VVSWAGSGELGLGERLSKNAPLTLGERGQLPTHERFATIALHGGDRGAIEALAQQDLDRRRARTSGTGASTRERAPQSSHCMSQTDCTVDPAASSNDVVGCSTFSAAPAASDSLTVAGSAFAAVASTVVSASHVDSETMRSVCFADGRFFGIRPCRSDWASNVASSSACGRRTQILQRLCGCRAARCGECGAARER
jgi:hypothetical protein